MKSHPSTLWLQLAAGGREGRLCSAQGLWPFFQDQGTEKTSPGVATVVVSSHACAGQWLNTPGHRVTFSPELTSLQPVLTLFFFFFFWRGKKGSGGGRYVLTDVASLNWLTLNHSPGSVSANSATLASVTWNNLKHTQPRSHKVKH